MAHGTILIGCRLPNGLTLSLPSDRNVKVTLAGLNKSQIIGASYVTTEVDAEFWAAWRAEYLDYAPFKNGAIFEAPDPRSASDIAKDFGKNKTGFEPMQPDSNDVKTADK